MNSFTGNEKNIIWINTGRALCMICVYIAHCNVYYLNHISPLYFLYKPFYLAFFFFLSGFLFFKNLDNFLFKKKISSILNKLVWPVIFFPSLIWVPKMIAHGGSIGLEAYLTDILGGTAAWFVSTIIVAQLISLLLVYVFKKRLFAMLLISIPVVNDLTAAQVKNRLEGLPLPENSMQVDSLSKAGKMTGNGNGMQYLGAILVESDLSLGEMKSHYAQFRANRWDCLVEVYHGGPLECVDIGNVQFHAELDSSKNYYVVYSWGSGLDFYEDWDLRGH